LDTTSDCLDPVTNQYNTEISEQMIRLSRAAYSDLPTSCPSDLFLPDWQVNDTFSSLACDLCPDNRCFGFTAYSVTQQSIVVVFRGTAENTQLVLEGLKSLTPIIPWHTGGKVMPYFNTAFSSLRSAVSDQITKLRRDFPSYKIYVTGHSLGGAMASLAALTLKSQFGISVTLYTFGQPRVGDYVFAKNFDKNIPDAWRVVHNLDPVPHLPPCQKTYNNGVFVCNPCPGLVNDYHHGTEVWYNSEENDYVVCNQGWPKDEVYAGCSNGAFNDQWIDDCIVNAGNCLNDHTYFGIPSCNSR